jgi:hypothetical protein
MASELRDFRIAIANVTKHCNNVHHLKFEDLFNNKKEAMGCVLEFLKLEPESIVYRPTFNSTELEDDNRWLSKGIQENPHLVLSSKQIQYCGLLMGNGNHSLNVLEILQFSLIFLCGNCFIVLELFENQFLLCVPKFVNKKAIFSK